MAFWLSRVSDQIPLLLKVEDAMCSRLVREVSQVHMRANRTNPLSDPVKLKFLKLFASRYVERAGWSVCVS